MSRTSRTAAVAGIALAIAAVGAAAALAFELLLELDSPLPPFLELAAAAALIVAVLVALLVYALRDVELDADVVDLQAERDRRRAERVQRRELERLDDTLETRASS